MKNIDDIYKKEKSLGDDPNAKNKAYRGASKDARRIYWIILLLSVTLFLGIIYVTQIKVEKTPSFEDLTYKFQPRKVTPYDSHIPEVYSLKDLCDNTLWQKDLYLNCTDLAGGTLNIQNSVVVCLRWAIDAGMGVLMPEIATRSKDDPRVFRDSWRPYTYLFDEEYFRKTLADVCPQLIIKETDFEPKTKVFAEIISMKQYTQGTYRSHIHDTLAHAQVDKKDGPIVVVERNPLLGWLFVKERPIIHKALLDIVRWNPSLTALAVPVISKLPEHFIGFHLRAEKDFPWYNYESIVSWFEKSYQAKYKYIKNIYLAVGSAELEEQFRDDMKKLDSEVNVISKWTLVSDNTTLISEFNNLRFDQLAIVDYEVLMHSDHLYGVGQSSFAYMIGFHRGNGSMVDCRCHIFDVPDPRFVCCM